MGVQTCTIDQYDYLRQGFELKAVIFDGNRQKVSTPHKALVLFCTYLIQQKVLSESKMWRVPFPWLRTTRLAMERPQPLPGGLYLEAAYDVNGPAPLLRINLLCKRLGIAPSRFLIEYCYESEPAPQTNKSTRPVLSHRDFLKECLASDGPMAEMRKTPSDFTETEVASFVPVRINLGKFRTYSLDGWKGFANWTIAYCLTRVMGAFFHLKNLQEASSWKYGQLIDTVNATHSMIPVAESCSDLDAFRVALAILDEVGFDRYSLSLECKRRGKTPQPPADANKPEPPRPSLPSVTRPSRGEVPRVARQPPESKQTKASRHLRPVFQIDKS